MTNAMILNYFILTLLCITVLAIIFFIRIWFYNKKGILFLNRMRKVVTEQGDEKELNRLITEDSPALKGLTPYIFYEILVALMILGVNTITYMYTLIPDAQLLSSWGVLTFMSSLGTTYVLLNISIFIRLKWCIDAICGSYDILLLSYKHMDEYKGKEK